MASSDIVKALEPVVEALEALGVKYRIGGSVASSACGVPRTTLDVDLVADLGAGHIREFVKRLQSRYYIDEGAVRAAVAHRSSFNLIHLESMFKVDVFVLKNRVYDQHAFLRLRRYKFGEASGSPAFCFVAPEDVVLNKLEWFRRGNEVSERQWTDVVGVLKVQQHSLDEVYMRQWASELGVLDLLERAFREARDGVR
jgi:hypothetical protein